MDEKWDLSALYDSFESDAFKNDFEKFKQRLSEYSSWASNQLKNMDTTAALEAYIDFQTGLGEIFSKLSAYSDLVLSVNVEEQNAIRVLESLENLEPFMTEPDAEFSLWLKGIDNLGDIINGSEKLKPYGFYLNELKEFSLHTLSKEEEKIISIMENTGSKAFCKLQENITATLAIEMEMDGKMQKLPLTVIRNMAHENNQDIRKRAYDKELEGLTTISKVSAACLNGIKGEVLSISGIRGYKDPLEMTLHSSRLSKETLDTMIGVIYEFLPEFRRYLRKKAEVLGHKNGLPFYDLFAPIGNGVRNFSYPEAAELVIKQFSGFSKGLGEYAKRAIEGKWIDVMPRSGKRGGAFCQNIHTIKESRIMLNFAGHFEDVLTLAHELGHGFHGECLKDALLLNADYPMPIAETASTFCETILNKGIVPDLSHEEQLTVLENEISGLTQVIVDILSRYIFESKVFEKRKEGSINQGELCEMMINAQKETYGDGLDFNSLHPYMWVVKPHYYDAAYNFYNFPYAFGQLLSKGLYAKYLSDKESFPEMYSSMLEASGRMNLRDTGLIAGIDINDKEFWRSSLVIIKEDIDRFVGLC